MSPRQWYIVMKYYYFIIISYTLTYMQQVNIAAGHGGAMTSAIV